MKNNKQIILLLFCITCFVLKLHAQSQKVEAVGFTVSDMDKAVNFYTSVLSFEKISDDEFSGADYEKLENVFGLHIRVVRMKLGDEIIELTDYLTSGGLPVPVDAQSNDLSFQHIAIVVSDMDKAYQQLRKYNVEHVSTAPQTLPLTNKAAAGIKAFYFHDPDKHNLELIFFPEGKGNPKWQVDKSKLFLGIDHTAIGVLSTERSLNFYRNILGLELKGESFNFGTEQEHLNNVEGASLHISGLRASDGPGLEFLEYLKPGPGLAYPSSAKSHDIIVWQTTLTVKDLVKLTTILKEKNYSFVSKEIVELEGKAGVKRKAVIVKDPDGHQILLQQIFNIEKELK